MADSLETKFAEFMKEKGIQPNKPGDKLSAMMTQREAYAGMFLQAIITHPNNLTDRERVNYAVELADKLIFNLENSVEKE